MSGREQLLLWGLGAWVVLFFMTTLPAYEVMRTSFSPSSNLKLVERGVARSGQKPGPQQLASLPQASSWHPHELAWIDPWTLSSFFPLQKRLDSPAALRRARPQQRELRLASLGAARFLELADLGRHAAATVKAPELPPISAEETPETRHGLRCLRPRLAEVGKGRANKNALYRWFWDRI